MEQLINFQSAAIQAVLPRLLEDKSTGRNIIWATEPPEVLQPDVSDKSEMTVAQLQQMGFDLLLPRTHKQSAAQQARTRKRGEVNTPAWLCCKMNDFLDSDWFGPERGSPFTVETSQGWQTVPEPVEFAPGRRKNSIPGRQKYVDSRRLEITCGEAPFLASRYDAATGEPIPVGQRIGILDRKLRIVNENTATEADWLKWAFRALQSVYGYEYQGDSLLLARTNLLLTFAEHLQARWQRSPTTWELKKAANIIAWNLFQMNGLTCTVPGGTRFQWEQQLNWFALMDGIEEPPPAVPCRVKNWRANKTQDVETIQEGSTSMKFDYVIGNPPYQDETVGTQKKFAPPVYNKFLDESYKVAKKVIMIHPARFLFDAGGTPKEWNQKMLNDSHLKVLFYEQDSAKVFANTDIKGGVAITYRDSGKNFGAIGTYTAYPELNDILKKVTSKKDFSSFGEIIANRGLYRFSKKTYAEHPKEMEKMTDSRVGASSFERMPGLFTIEKPSDGKDYAQFLGLQKSNRTYRWFRTDYFNPVESFEHYKVLLPAANGSGALGETLSTPLIGQPRMGHTETFLSIGNFENEQEAEACLSYIKSKFCRVLLGVLKITQHNSADKWKYVPLQDFTSNSDIDWSKSVADIDRQLYKKYDLSADEIDFIETHVKEMA